MNIVSERPRSTCELIGRWSPEVRIRRSTEPVHESFYNFTSTRDWTGSTSPRRKCWFGFISLCASCRREMKHLSHNAPAKLPLRGGDAHLSRPLIQRLSSSIAEANFHPRAGATWSSAKKSDRHHTFLATIRLPDLVND